MGTIGTVCNLGAFNDDPTKNLVRMALGFFLRSTINQQYYQVWVLQIVTIEGDQGHMPGIAMV